MKLIKLLNTTFDELVRMHEQSYLQKETVDFLRLILDQRCIFYDGCIMEVLIPDKYGQNKKDLFLGVINEHLVTIDDVSWKLFIKKFIDIMNSWGKQAEYILRNTGFDPTETSSISSNNFRITRYHEKKADKD